MIKAKKIILNGLSIDKESIADFGLEAIVLNRLELIENLETPLGKARGLLTSSKISKFTNDYDFIDIVPIRKEIESRLCFVTKNGVIYCDREDKYIVFRSSISHNTYSTDSYSYSWKKIKDELIICEEISSNSTKVSYFDVKLNLLNQEIRPYIFDIVNKTDPFNAETPEMISLNNFQAKNPNISPHLYKYGLEEIHKHNDVVIHCYDYIEKKKYVIFFENGIKEKWRFEVIKDALVIYDFIFANDYYYGTYSLNKIGHKWRVIKIDRNGVIVDCFDFKGANPICTKFNEKLAIVFDDIKNFDDWQKELLKEKQYIGPSGIIIIDEEE